LWLVFFGSFGLAKKQKLKRGSGFSCYVVIDLVFLHFFSFSLTSHNVVLRDCHIAQTILKETAEVQF